MRVELLYFGGCPGALEALGAIERVVAGAQFAADVVPIDVGTGTPPGFSGSPTLLVDGEDPFPATRTDATSCRLYKTPEGLRGSPTDAMLSEIFAERSGSRTEAP